MRTRRVSEAHLVVRLCTMKAESQTRDKTWNSEDRMTAHLMPGVRLVMVEQPIHRAEHLPSETLGWCLT